MLRNYPLEPIGQSLLISKCGRLKAWMPKAFSNQNDPVIPWVFFSSTTSKAFQKSAFPQHFLGSLGVIMSGAVGAGSRGKPDTLCALLPTGHCRTPVPRFDTEMSLHEFSIEHVPHLCAKQPSGAFFGSIGTNLWAVKLWVTSVLCQTIRWASELGVFLNGEYFTVVSGSLLTMMLSWRRNHSISDKSLLHFWCWHHSHLTAGRWKLSCLV